jgi:hypothetical protein
LLEQYRSVAYVIHLIDAARAITEMMGGAPLQKPPPLQRPPGDKPGAFAGICAAFPAQEWLLAVLQSPTCGADLGVARTTLELFVPYSIPPGDDPFDFLSAMQGRIWDEIGADLTRIPRTPRAQRKYFEHLYDDILQSRIVQPRPLLTTQPLHEVDEYVFLAAHCRPYPDICARAQASLSKGVATWSIFQGTDESGEEAVAGLFRVTLDQYKRIRRKLVGPEGVLGERASIMTACRVTYWDYVQRNYTANFDVVARGPAPLANYLALLREEFFDQWAPRQKSPVMPYLRTVLADPLGELIDRRVAPPKRTVHLTPGVASRLKAAFFGQDASLSPLDQQRFGGRYAWDLNWPAYGLDRYILLVFLSARNPRFIFDNLLMPATRRVLISTTVLGFQTAFIEYLWPKDSPDDRFLRYVASRTERNVLSYSLHKVLAETRFYNLDRVGWVGAAENISALDLQLMLLAQPPGLARLCTAEFPYRGDPKFRPGAAEFEAAVAALGPKGGKVLSPQTGRRLFHFDPRALGLKEKSAIVARGEFEAVPLCLTLPAGQYFRTEEIYYSSTERLVDQAGHIFLFDFPRANVAQLNNFLADMIRDRAARHVALYHGLENQNLASASKVWLGAINPLHANPFNATNDRFYHLPKRRLENGKWVTLSLEDQVRELRAYWEGENRSYSPQKLM